VKSDLISVAREAFGVTPDPQFLYFGPSHRDALASLIHGIESDRGFLVLVGSPGAGKTTLLFELLQHYRDSAETVFLFQTQSNSTELLRYVLMDCGIEAGEADFVQMHAILNEHLIKVNEAGKRFLLFIDESQNLKDEVLETVRLLSDFERPQKKLIQVVLSGQPRLLSTLSRPTLFQLRQRISLFAQLEPFAGADVANYIRHRLAHSLQEREHGIDVHGLFTPAAMAAIAEVTNGIPREIHNLCFGALSLASASGATNVDSSVVRKAASELRPDSQPRRDSYVHRERSDPAPRMQVARDFEERAPQTAERSSVSTQQRIPEAAQPQARSARIDKPSFAAPSTPQRIEKRDSARSEVCRTEPTKRQDTSRLRRKRVAARLGFASVALLLIAIAGLGLYPADLTRNLANQFGGLDVVLASARATSGTEAGLGSESATVSPRLIDKTTPIYPLAALKAGIEGEVVLSATIAKDGHLKDIKRLSGDPLLARAAIDAAASWRYQPYLMNSVPTEMKREIRFHFKRQAR
jgi:TonB family protein